MMRKGRKNVLCIERFSGAPSYVAHHIFPIKSILIATQHPAPTTSRIINNGSLTSTDLSPHPKSPTPPPPTPQLAAKAKDRSARLTAALAATRDQQLQAQRLEQEAAELEGSVPGERAALQALSAEVQERTQARWVQCSAVN